MSLFKNNLLLWSILLFSGVLLSSCNIPGHGDNPKPDRQRHEVRFYDRMNNELDDTRVTVEHNSTVDPSAFAYAKEVLLESISSY